MFLKTFDISQTMVDYAKGAYDEEGHRRERLDRRGGGNKTPQQCLDAVITHINSFPRVS